MVVLPEEAAAIALEYYNLEGQALPLPGELDFNFRIRSGDQQYILKISRPGADEQYVAFMEAILTHLANQSEAVLTPQIIKNVDKKSSFRITDKSGNQRIVRMLSWLDGRLWSEVNPHSGGLLKSLGRKAGELTNLLQGFDHKMAHRDFDWDIARLAWTREHINLFDAGEQELIRYFLEAFEGIENAYSSLPKSVVHNDVNDNNIVVSNVLADPEVRAIIDFGDTVYTQTINDLAITIAYAAMDKPEPLEAACNVVSGYAEYYSPGEHELEALYVLVAARLIISLTKSAINKRQEPDNEYLLISEQPAWALLKKWRAIPPQLAMASFRYAAGLTPHPDADRFEKIARKNISSVRDLIPAAKNERVIAPDLGVDSRWAGTLDEQNDIDLLTHRFKLLQKKNIDATIAGGYGETRSIYSTDAYKIETNNGPEFRTVHLGVDFWFPAGTEITSILPGKVFSLVDNDRPKDYGVTLILEHEIEGLKFYSLYGHLGKKSLDLFKKGDTVKEGDLIGYLGNPDENGGWSPHLHFQLMLDLLGNTSDFPGVAVYRDKDIWLNLCPNPGLLFKETIPEPRLYQQELIDFRKDHLGKGLSLSYSQPLTIVRGSGAWLIDHTGRKYLDTVNNVAHVGHEHPVVVRAGQEQMAVLNTNTRYLNRYIIEFAEELLATFPENLSVVHFVNSGSEANELALRMAKTVTGEVDMIAMEVGYHGNTSGCIDVSSYKFDGKGGSGCPPHTHLVPLPDQYRGIYQGPDCGTKYASHVHENIAAVKQNGRNIAGFICESIISCGGQIELPEGFLAEAYAAIRAAGGLCIADEVQVGCGRVGSHFWGFQLHGVIPDIVTIGKPIGNGHPLAAVVCTEEVAEAFANGMEYFNTFGGNPVSSIIGKTVLEVIRQENLQENALEVGSYLKDRLAELKAKHQIIGDVRGQGLFLGFELNGADKSPLPDQASYLVNRMKELGVLMSIDGPDHNVIKIKPPMVFSKANADELIKRLLQVLEEDFMVNY